MKVLNIEDDACKSSRIGRVLKPITGQNIDWKTNLEDGIKAIREASVTTPYDLIITDMYYPETHGAPESQSGILLVDRALEAGWNIPRITSLQSLMSVCTDIIILVLCKPKYYDTIEHRK